MVSLFLLSSGVSAASTLLQDSSRAMMSPESNRFSLYLLARTSTLNLLTLTNNQISYLLYNESLFGPIMQLMSHLCAYVRVHVYSHICHTSTCMCRFDVYVYDSVTVV